MNHTLDVTELDGFESRTTLASSTKDNKKLEIVSRVLKNGELISDIQVTSKSITRIITQNLQHAIEHYNKY